MLLTFGHCQRSGSFAPWRAAPRRELRGQALQHSREWDRLTHVGQAAHPRDHPLDPGTETGVGKGPVTSQVQVPTERLGRQLMMRYSGLKYGEVILTLAPADHLAVTLGREHIHAHR